MHNKAIERDSTVLYGRFGRIGELAAATYGVAITATEGEERTYSRRRYFVISYFKTSRAIFLSRARNQFDDILCVNEYTACAYVKCRPTVTRPRESTTTHDGSPATK